MPVPVFSILSTDEAKAAVKLQSTDAAVVARLESMCGWVAELMEQLGETYFVERNATPLVEVHDLAAPQGFIQLRRRPVIGAVVLAVGDPAQTVDAANYYVDEALGLVMMKGGTANARHNRQPPSMWAGNPSWVDFPEDYYSRYGGSFAPVPQAATVTYRGGFQTTAAVPGDLKRAAGNILARWWREEERKSQGLQSEIAQGFTFATKYSDKLVSEEDRAIIRMRGNLSRTARSLPPRVDVGYGTLVGFVYDAFAVPVPGATVYACPSGLSAVTGLTGAYSISNVPGGDIVVKAGEALVGSGLDAAVMTDGAVINLDLTIALPYVSPECT